MTPTRARLYDWVWRVPLSQVAQLMHMSPANLRKICRKLDIPTPPRGFWRQFETGVTVEQDALPDPDHDPPLRQQVDEKALQAALDSARRGPMVLRAAAQPTGESLPHAGERDDVGVTTAELVASPAAPALDARRTHESATAGGGATVSPTLSCLLSLGELSEKLRAARDLLARVRALQGDCDPATRAVLTLWLERAEEELTAANAALMIQHACSRIARGAEQPEWWAAATSGDQRSER